MEGRWEAYVEVEGRAYVEVGCRWEAYVGVGGVCWKWRGDGRRMLEVGWRWEAYV